MFSTLSVAQTGLHGSKYGIDNVSNNQANKDTPGYKKRVANLSEIGQYGEQHITGRGLSFDGVSRVISQYMYDKFMQEGTKANYYDKLSNMLNGVENIFKENEGNGFSADLDRYFQAMENLRTNPSSEVYRSHLRSQGSVVVDSLKNLYSSVQKQQAIERRELETDINRANSILKEIAETNAKIEKYDPAINDLLDKRDLLELELSKFVDVEIDREQYFYQIKVGGVIALSNDVFERKIEINDVKTNQIDKYNHLRANADGSTTVFDALKYNDDFTAKPLYDPDDVITYKLNNEFSVSVRIGESVTGDWDGSGTLSTQVVDNDNITRAMMVKINNSSDMSKFVTAYNGEYVEDPVTGKMVPMYPHADNYLRIESNIPGKENDFIGSISVERKTGTNVDGRERIYRNELVSKDAHSDVVLRIYEQDLSLKAGSTRAQVENLSTSHSNNKFQSYLDMLDNFAQTLADLTSSYIRVGTNDYIYGRNGSDGHNTPPFPPNGGDIVELNLFSGASIKTLQFHKGAVDYLKQDDLDYLASVQWKKDLSFEGEGKAQDPGSINATSLTEYFRKLRVNISIDGEEARHTFEIQDAISQNLGEAYNNVVKVNPDDELIDLMKFQAAFNANAKVITAVDEMIQTLLGMKR